MLDARLLQNRVQVSLIETAEPMLVHDDISGLRLEFLDDVRAPGIADQNASVPAIRRLDRLSHTKHLQVPNPVWSVRSPQIRQVGAIPHLEIDDLDASTPGGFEDSCS